MRNLRIPTLLLLAGAACHSGTAGGPPPGPAQPPAPPPIASAGDILARVAAAFPGEPRTVAFTQVNVIALASGDITQRQRVLFEAPARLRVDNLPVAGRTGAIYAGGRAITFSGGRRVAASSEQNPLLLLGFGVFHQPVAESLAGLAALGVRTSVIREASFEGAPVWIVGAAPGDTTSNQVWFDSRRWLPVRLIQSQRVGTRTLVSDTRYSGHAAPGPSIPRVLEVYRDGRRALRGTVEDLRTGITVPPATFDTIALRPVTY